MPLSEDRRKQLDSIVQQMAANGEADDNVRAVVEDFKGKYGSEAAPSMSQKAMQFVKDHPYMAAAATVIPGVGAMMPQTSGQVAIGAVKGLGSDAYGLMTSKLAGPIGMGLGYLGDKTGITQKVQAATAPANPAQQIGGHMATIAEMAIPSPKLASAASEMMPSAERAGQKFQQVMQAVGKNTPVNIDAAAPAALRAEQLSQAGFTRPGVLKKTLGLLSPGAEQPGFQFARDLQANAGALSAVEKTTIKPMMKAQVNALAKALSESNQAAAEAAGVGELYSSAVNEYRRAMMLRSAGQSVKDLATSTAAKWVALGVGGGAGGYAASKLGGLLGQ